MVSDITDSIVYRVGFLWDKWLPHERFLAYVITMEISMGYFDWFMKIGLTIDSPACVIKVKGATVLSRLASLPSFR